MKPLNIGTGITQWFADELGNVYWQYQSNFKLASVQLTNKGYPYIQVGGHRYLVHRLVATAYLDKPDGCNVVNHLDENKTNNAISNLEWTTQSGNMKHYYRDKHYKLHGSLNCNAKLTEAIVTEIKRRLLAGDTGTSLAKEYGVAHGRIYDIKHGRSWSHV